MRVPIAAWSLIKTFSSKATTTGFIKCASKEAIPRAILFVFRERALAVAGGLWARHFSRHQPRHGVAVRRGAGAAGAEARSSVPGAAAYRVGARALHCDNHCRGSRGSHQLAAPRLENCRGGDPVCLWPVSFVSIASPELGRHASGFWRLDTLVVYHGISARRRIDACPVLSRIASCAERASPRFACAVIRKFQRAFSARSVGHSPHIGVSYNDGADRDCGLRKTWGRDTAPRVVQHRFGLDGRADGYRGTYPFLLICHCWS